MYKNKKNTSNWWPNKGRDSLEEKQQSEGIRQVF